MRWPEGQSPEDRLRQPLPREFYLTDANTAAKNLLGKLLVHRTPEGTAAGIIVETEAYVGASDKGAHSYPNKRTPRTEIQFGPGGYAYVYQIYGMHCCFNVVANGPDVPEAVLIRALEPAVGLELMARRRRLDDPKNLCNGPGKLCAALDITRDQYGCDLTGRELYILPCRDIPAEEIRVSPRINIDYAEECRDYLWRYFIRDNPFVSRVPKKYQSQPMQ